MITFPKLFQLIIKYDDNITPELEKYITEVNEAFVNISTEYVSWISDYTILESDSYENLLYIQEKLSNKFDYIETTISPSYREIMTNGNNVNNGNNGLLLFKSRRNITNKIFMKSMPIPYDTLKLIHNKNTSELVDLLNQTFQINIKSNEQILLGDTNDITNINIIINMNKNIYYFTNDVVKHCILGFKWGLKTGLLMNSKINGSIFIICDIIAHPDVYHRSPGKLIPLAKRAIWSSVYNNEPKICEPVCSCIINYSKYKIRKIKKKLNELINIKKIKKIEDITINSQKRTIYLNKIHVSQLIILIPYLKDIDADMKINYKFDSFSIIDDDISKDIIKHRRKFLKLGDFCPNLVKYDKL
tara:strand:+ start:111 stop:1187 length:1077 start_codon:yes stop_codon:yes gene_type:complete